MHRWPRLAALARSIWPRHRDARGEYGATDVRTMQGCPSPMTAAMARTGRSDDRQGRDWFRVNGLPVHGASGTDGFLRRPADHHETLRFVLPDCG